MDTPAQQPPETEEKRLGIVEILRRATSHEFIEQIHIVPMFGAMIKASRASAENKKVAIVQMMVPDDFVMNINGIPEMKDSYYLLRIPKLVTDIMKVVKEPSNEDKTGND